MISREEAIESLERVRELSGLKGCRENIAINMAIEALSNERPKGRWEFDVNPITHNWLYRCTSCNGWEEDTPPFCPNCGAEMER